ncbi:hypothetical protein ACIRD9_41510 [Streptomyces violaceus]|uniref:hypothetical protein n=1 Tax=Streptomyces violaceus TaxID=1936 RepID=UPI0037FDA18E
MDIVRRATDAEGMDASTVAAALEDARVDARQVSRHEHLAGDGGRSELAEGEDRPAARRCGPGQPLKVGGESRGAVLGLPPQCLHQVGDLLGSAGGAGGRAGGVVEQSVLAVRASG